MAATVQHPGTPLRAGQLKLTLSPTPTAAAPHLCAGAWPGPSTDLRPWLGDADGPPEHPDVSQSPAPPGSVRPVNASAACLQPESAAEGGVEVTDNGAS